MEYSSWIEVGVSCFFSKCANHQHKRGKTRFEDSFATLCSLLTCEIPPRAHLATHFAWPGRSRCPGSGCKRRKLPSPQMGTEPKLRSRTPPDPSSGGDAHVVLQVLLDLSAGKKQTNHLEAHLHQAPKKEGPTLHRASEPPINSAPKPRCGLWASGPK